MRFALADGPGFRADRSFRFVLFPRLTSPHFDSLGFCFAKPYTGKPLQPAETLCAILVEI
jgi:hypothetical protein